MNLYHSIASMLLLVFASANLAQNLENYLVFNRGLVLNEVIDEVKVTTGSSIWMIDPAKPATTLTRVTPDESASSLMPSWDSIKEKIVFSSNRENQGSPPALDIWSINADGSELLRLTENANHNWTPAWSPDGSKIVFASTRNSPQDPNQVWRFDIFVMNADGSNQTLLADIGVQDEDPVFSADGTTVFFVAEITDECFQLRQVPTAGGAAAPLLDNESNAICGEDPSLSPDGRTLFFWNNATGSLAGLDLQTSVVTNYSFDAFEPWIGPTGDQFVYMSDGNIFISDLDGNNPVQITTGGNDFFPRWAGPLGQMPTSVNEFDEARTPGTFALLQNYPNPFNPSTTIRFSISEVARVTLKVFDLLGREMATLVDEELQPNLHYYQFEAEGLPSGVYFYQLQAIVSGKSLVQTKKLILLR